MSNRHGNYSPSTCQVPGSLFWKIKKIRSLSAIFPQLYHGMPASPSFRNVLYNLRTALKECAGRRRVGNYRGTLTRDKCITRSISERYEICESHLQAN
ncbi:hypothetical protein RRG08_048508 [Elysia crispata]|uniref:Uncharacterized protein n=1 Tax=Elysia crispata TaxID=231223 RepID=A0AAE0YG89_9GAST|nr:hypothetical protein RRG08_048508 [Elysia crispata]